MSRLLVLAAVSSLLVSGCSAGLMAAGGGMIVAGGYTLSQPDHRCVSDGSVGGSLECGLLEDPINDVGNGVKDASGVLMLVAGAALLIGGLVMHERENTEHELAVVRTPPAYVPVAMTPPRATEPVEASGATLAIRARVENRLAIQASTMASRGACAGVVPTMHRLAEIDPEMHRTVLASDANVADCLAFTMAGQAQPSDPALAPAAP